MYTQHGDRTPRTTESEKKLGPPSPERLQASDFVAKIEEAEEWWLQRNWREPYILVLCVREGNELKYYQSPDFLDMSAAESRLFFVELERVAGGPGTEVKIK